MNTKLKIIKAMADSLVDTTLDQLTVSDICERANISRPTFYRNFQDKYGATTWYLGQIVDETCRKTGVTLGWHSAYLAFFKTMETNKNFHKRLVESLDYNAVSQSSKRSLERTFLEAYRHKCGDDLDDLIVYQIHIFALIDVQAITEWLMANCEPPAEEFVETFLTLVPRELFNALDMGDEGSDDLLFIVI